MVISVIHSQITEQEHGRVAALAYKAEQGVVNEAPLMQARPESELHLRWDARSSVCADGRRLWHINGLSIDCYMIRVWGVRQ